jgi:tetratricopeptide (TPR) repeat protein
MNTAKTSKRRAIRSRASLHRATLAAVFALSLAMMPGGAAQAQQLDSVSREAASALAVAGLEAYEAGSYEEAFDKLEKAYTVARVPTLGLWSARTLYKLGQWREAEDRYREAIGLGLPDGDRETQQRALVDAQAELAALTPTIPKLMIEVEGARLDEIELRIDGKPVSTSEAAQRLNPGPHRVEGSRGDEHQAVDVSLVPRDTRTILLRFAPQPVAPASAPQAHESNWLRTTGWVAVGAGAAGVAVGTVALVLAIDKKSDIDHDDACQNNKCPTNKQDLVDSYNSLRTLSTVGFVTGSVLAAAGVSALVISGKTPSEPHVEAIFSPGFTGLQGSF